LTAQSSFIISLDADTAVYPGPTNTNTVRASGDVLQHGETGGHGVLRSSATTCSPQDTLRSHL
jgi:hypothetical protein